MKKSTLTVCSKDAIDVQAPPPSAAANPERSGGRGDGLHVAIVMDGNGRWATSLGRVRAAGHVAGSEAVRRTVECAPRVGITTLTLYAFSSDNWRRPHREVGHLMRLFEEHLDSEAARLAERGVRLSIIGRRDRLSDSLRDAIDRVEHLTRQGMALHLRIAIDYSARDAILAAAGLVAEGIPPTREAFERSLAQATHAPSDTRDVDLLIRTGGEKRLSDFLLWECAYAEFLFLDVMWPEFGEVDLAAAIDEFAARERRFGGLPSPFHRPRIEERRAAS